MSRPCSPPLVSDHASTSITRCTSTPSVTEEDVSDKDLPSVAYKSTENKLAHTSPPVKFYSIEDLIDIAKESVPIPRLEDAVISFRGKHFRNRSKVHGISYCDFEQRGWEFIQEVTYKSGDFFGEVCHVSDEVADLFSTHCCEIMERYEHRLSTITSSLQAAHDDIDM